MHVTCLMLLGTCMLFRPAVANNVLELSKCILVVDSVQAQEISNKHGI